MRGLPLSGKSTKAKQIIEESGYVGVSHSTNSFFMVNGVYRFSRYLLTEYHRRNQQNFFRSLKAEVPIVICDNTNIELRDYEYYYKTAHQFGYEVAFEVLPVIRLAAFRMRNTIGIPEDTFICMKRRFKKECRVPEPYPEEELESVSAS